MATTNNPVTPTPWLGRYTIDANRSSITFRTRHFFQLLPAKGAFAIRGGTVEVAEPLAESSLAVEVDAAGFRTGNAQRDQHVRSEAFLDVTRHPLITFASGSVDATAVSGTLTVRDVSRPVSLAIEHAEVSAETFTVRATARIDRHDFGVSASRLMAGRFLDMTFEVTCVRR
ncbi:YceI family protein [Streptomyces sp. TS71-3]|uniref:YceI family protein n=1 Tax=Streptomyces sp. TS71-3 TaxID=2733862 RepID=UPI001B0CF403|nr:YceI family protein [Streptomyces sp. TS71-3]GHJ35568.1 hypothetical protein Sm713_11770 [Streptomyces sp. TS71-3]